MYKASAGSGKTFQLTRHFLELLFRDEKNYSKILAVTFTNKAAGELKERVLRELVLIGSNQTDKSAHFDHLSQLLNRKADVLVPRAKRILLAILHDYSHFSIGTIDEFFQNVLRSFTRELGIYSGYQVELDAGKLLLSAIERLIAKSGEDPLLFDWMLEGISEKIEEGKAWRRYEKDLHKLGNELLKEELSIFIMDSQTEIFSTGKIRSFRDKLIRIIRQFHAQIQELVQETTEVIEQSGLEFTDFKQGNSSPLVYLLNLEKGNYDPKTRRAALNGTEAWLNKSGSAAARIAAIPLIETRLIPILTKAINLFDSDFPNVVLAGKIKDQLLALGMASLLSREMIEISREENSFLLSFTNPVIADLIKGNPAPFIYEKTGRYYQNYMIDEFQDTSDLQWGNFLPLIRDSLAQGETSLVVGDAKQSIYRWRNSNWQLMASVVEKQLLAEGKKPINLQFNYRSRHSIIDFNNLLFSKAGVALKEHLEEQFAAQSRLPSEALESFARVYSDVKQQFGTKKTGGYVELQFSPDKDEYGFPDKLEHIFGIIEELQLVKNYQAREIVFLVRSKKQGADLIRFFNKHLSGSQKKEACNYQLVSAESLRLDSSAALRALMAAIALTESPDNLDLIRRFVLEYLSRKKGLLDDEDLERIVHADQPEILHQLGLADLRTFLKQLFQSPINEMIERIIRHFDLAGAPEDVSFVLTFKELVYANFGFQPVCSPSELMEWWEEIGSSSMLTMDDSVDAMRIMTIHKAKGLEFPVVIMPYCDWSMDHDSTKSPLLWLPTRGTPFSDLPIVPVSYSKDLLIGSFAGHYMNEKIQIYLDNLNLLYVAFTRAEDYLYLFIPLAKKPSLSRVGGILQGITEPDPDTGLYSFGDPDTTRITRHKTFSKRIQLDQYPGGREWKLKQSLPFESSETDRGELIHQIFEKIDTLADVEPVIRDFVEEGLLVKAAAEDLHIRILSLLEKEEIKAYYTGAGKLIKEKSILLPGKGIIRPDRVVILDNELAVLDYKTGKIEEQHKNQIRDYMQILEQLESLPVKGFLLYLDQDQVVAV